MKKLIIIFVTFLVLSRCLTDDPLKMPFQTFIPPNLGDGWEIASPSDLNIDTEALQDVYKYVHHDDGIWQIRSLLVIRNNMLAAESYMKDADDRTTPGAVWSCTKQVVGILTGIAVDQGLLLTTDTIADHLPNVSSSQHSEKSQITIDNLLSMRSGIDYENGGITGNSTTLLRQKPSNSLEYVLRLGVDASPGTKYRYKDGDPHIMSAILQERTGKTMRDWAWEVLFNRIGITRLQWHTYKDGITMGGFGILTTPRELAKIGQLVLNDGMWKGEQIVSSAWITEMTSSKISDSETHENNITFGYFWWKDTRRDISIMRGHGGQYVFINKPKNLIVVITSEPNTQDDFQLTLNQGLAIYDRINGITY